MDAASRWRGRVRGGGVGPFGVDLIERHGLEKLEKGGEDASTVGEVRQLEVASVCCCGARSMCGCGSSRGSGRRGRVSAGVAVVPGVLAEVDGHDFSP